MLTSNLMAFLIWPPPYSENYSKNTATDWDRLQSVHASGRIAYGEAFQPEILSDRVPV